MRIIFPQEWQGISPIWPLHRLPLPDAISLVVQAETSTSVLGRFENIIDFSHISLRPLSVPHLDTELRGVKIRYQFQVVMEG